MTATISNFLNTYVKPLEHPVRAWSSGVKGQFDFMRWRNGNNLLGDSLHGLFLETLDSLIYLQECRRIDARFQVLEEPDRQGMLSRMDQIRLMLYVNLGAVTVLNGLYYFKPIHRYQPLSNLVTAAHQHIPLIKAIMSMVLSAGEYRNNKREICLFTAGAVSYLLRANQAVPKPIIQIMNLFALFRTAVIFAVGNRFEKASKVTFFAYNFFIVPKLLATGNPK